MKKQILILMLLIVVAVPLMAQTESTTPSSENGSGEIKTLFKSPQNPPKIGYYISPEFAWTWFGDKDVLLGGLSAGVIINHSFTVGLAAKAIVNSNNLWYDRVQDTTGAYLYGGYGGIKFEFKLFPEKPVHLSFPLVIGGGGMVYNTWQHGDHMDYNYVNYSGYSLDSDGFFVIEPGVMVELNLLKFMRLNAGATYRYTAGFDLVNTSAGLLNNFNANISLVFGKF